MRDARAYEVVTLTSSSHEALPVNDRHLLTAAPDQPPTLQLCGGVRDRWPLDPEHVRKQVLTDEEYVIVAAITHHQHSHDRWVLQGLGMYGRYGRDEGTKPRRV